MGQCQFFKNYILQTGQASAESKTQRMPFRVDVRDDESIDQALERFNQIAKREFSRPWCKRRYGYYEKPSELRRKQKKMTRLNSGRGKLLLHIGLKELHCRTGPTNAAGK